MTAASEQRIRESRLWQALVELTDDELATVCHTASDLTARNVDQSRIADVWRVIGVEATMQRLDRRNSITEAAASLGGHNTDTVERPGGWVGVCTCGWESYVTSEHDVSVVVSAHQARPEIGHADPCVQYEASGERQWLPLCSCKTWVIFEAVDSLEEAMRLLRDHLADVDALTLPDYFEADSDGDGPSVEEFEETWHRMVGEA